MAQSPMLTDYVGLIMQRFDQFRQARIEQGIKKAKSSTYCSRSFIIFFIMMQFHGIYGFKTQWRWLTMVDFRINWTLPMHSQPPKSLPRFYRDVPLIRGTLETSRKSELLVNVYLFI